MTGVSNRDNKCDCPNEISPVTGRELAAITNVFWREVNKSNTGNEDGSSRGNRGGKHWGNIFDIKEINYKYKWNEKADKLLS